MNHLTLAVAADMASRAYQQTVQINSFTVTQYSHGHVQWFSARSGGDLWIAFCGTNEADDWIFNLNVGKEISNCGHVHDGFNRALDTVWSSVMDEIARGRLERLTFVGHSLGGALAAIAASRLIFSPLCSRMYLWTFGQPRCGDRQWADWMEQQLNSRYVRTFNAGDPIPHVPTRLRFCHAGRELFFDKDGTATEPTLWQRVSAAMGVIVTQFWSSVVWLGAHSMDRYRSNVLKLLEER